MAGKNKSFQAVALFRWDNTTKDWVPYTAAADSKGQLITTLREGGIYNSSAPTITNGQRNDFQLDVNGNLKTTLATLIAGEDLTNDVLKVEERFSYAYQAAAAANVVVKASAGFLHAIIVGAFVASGIIEVSDHASDGDGNVKIKITGAATNIDGFPKTILVDAVFSTGICADITNFTDVTFIYR